MTVAGSSVQPVRFPQDMTGTDPGPIRDGGVGAPVARQLQGKVSEGSESGHLFGRMVLSAMVVLPAGVAWPQAQKHLPGRLVMHGEGGVMLDHDMDIAEVSLQRVGAVD